MAKSQRQVDLGEFEDDLDYIVCSRSARTVHWGPAAKMNKPSTWETGKRISEFEASQSYIRKILSQINK